MSPGVGAPELLVLLILALVVVGPKDLPLMVRRVGRFFGRVRALANDFRRSFDELGREAELAELRQEIEALKSADPLSEVKREIDAADAQLRAGVEDRAHPRAPGEAAAPPSAAPEDDAAPRRAGGESA